ncbi:hypothetical protein SDRG_12759 [Saprolegnia diclina VS20]|uniref:Uncharacterized protein n=1 Tax=Saprolegnia diclina (strain VS20) TaxID=1156394 RepID=T0Q7T3_SAPDV|nr:hypothetical protein SDRG_12759 [Saprolegnia diclina VS20]EQC29510.1 hypothetical protein SDRG_12759 [Saprolegnia diclina VS20]|eukprot:XP_008617062.1 hypothetical protein SDRG_12759 [Saprolegnia diclina VS20]
MERRGIDELEQDTAGAEDLSPDEITALLFPVAWQSYHRFAVAYSKLALRGWVKQPSPSCAAASLAGALNTLHEYGRDHPAAFSTRHVLDVYCHLFRDKINRQRAQLETLLAHSLASLEAAVEQSLAAEGLRLGGVGDAKVSKKSRRRHVAACVAHLASDETSVFRALTSAVVAVEDAAATPDDAGDDDAVATELSLGSDRWRPALDTYFHRLDGLAKLERDDKPSTAICGNHTLLEAANYIFSTSPPASASRLATLKGRHFMGKSLRGVQVECVASASDNNTGRLEVLWRALWAAFTDDNTVLLFHLTNHYALLFALREWVDETSGHVRQVLTARKGQRPTAWIDFDDVHRMLCGWGGYRILAFQRTTTRV